MSNHQIESFIDVYQNLNRDNLFLLKDIYSHDVEFIDPLHSVKGLQQLEDYFQHLYTHVISIHFEIEDYTKSEQKGFLYWTMTYSHKSLNSANPISVKGHSRLIFERQKVRFHQDYLDTNAMIFEHVPVVGRLIKHMKSKACK